MATFGKDPYLAVAYLEEKRGAFPLKKQRAIAFRMAKKIFELTDDEGQRLYTLEDVQHCIDMLAREHPRWTWGMTFVTENMARCRKMQSHLPGVSVVVRVARSARPGFPRMEA